MTHADDRTSERDRPSRLRRWIRRAVITVAALALAMVLGVVGLVVGVSVWERATAPDNVPAPFESLPEAGADELAPDLVVFDSDRAGPFEIFTMTGAGEVIDQLTDDPRFDSWWPRVSPDRRRILFYRTPAGVHDRDFTKTALWMMDADGSGAIEIRPPGTDGWHQQGHAEWSPDGASLVMFGGKRTNPQIYVTTVSGREPRQITRRGGVSLDPSFSPDGSVIAFIGCPRAVCFPSDYEVYTVPRAGGEARRLTSDSMRDQDPYFAPDGRSIAWLTQERESGGPIGVWNIRIAAADGSDARWLTHDQHVNSKPEWTRDGSTVLFHRLVYGSDDLAFDIWSIRPDGTGLQPLTVGQPGVNEFPST